MKKLLPAILLIATTGVANAQMPTPEEAMAMNDTNKDGFVTKAEAEAAGTPLAQFFDMFDADHDGKISLAEMKAGLEGFASGGPPPGAGAPPPGGAPRGGGAPPAGK